MNIWFNGIAAEDLDCVYTVKITVDYGRFTISKTDHFRANPQVAPKTWAIKLVASYLWL